MQKKSWLKLTPCLSLLLMTACETLNLEQGISPVADSYCTTYIPIVRAEGEGKIKAPLQVRKRILANEETYRGLCAPQGNK